MCEWPRGNKNVPNQTHLPSLLIQMVRPIHVSLVRVCIVPSQGYDAGYACVSRSRLLADEMPHLAARLNGEFFYINRMLCRHGTIFTTSLLYIIYIYKHS